MASNSNETAVSGLAEQFATFYVGEMLCGIQVKSVQEIIRFQEMTPVPLASPVIRGLINLRGQIITAIDMRRRMGLPERDAEQMPMNVVVRTSDGTGSLLVDRIGDVLEVKGASFEATPVTIEGAIKDLITGVYKLSEQLLLVVDTERAVEISAN